MKYKQCNIIINTSKKWKIHKIFYRSSESVCNINKKIYWKRMPPEFLICSGWAHWWIHPSRWKSGQKLLRHSRNGFRSIRVLRVERAPPEYATLRSTVKKKYKKKKCTSYRHLVAENGTSRIWWVWWVCVQHQFSFVINYVAPCSLERYSRSVQLIAGTILCEGTSNCSHWCAFIHEILKWMSY